MGDKFKPWHDRDRKPGYKKRGKRISPLRIDNDLGKRISPLRATDKRAVQMRVDDYYEDVDDFEGN